MLRSVVIAAHLCGCVLAGAPAAARAGDTAPPSWSYSAAAFLYLVPEDRDYLQPTVTADREWLHFEARYNYEDFKTISLWAGYNFSAGSAIAFALTPQVGLLFGEMSGVAPGGRVSLDWKQLSFYSEGEYVFDVDASYNSFFYSWSELNVTPAERLRTGLAVQRTQAYETPREFSGGILLGVTVGRAEITGHAFDLDLPDITYVLSVSAEF